MAKHLIGQSKSLTGRAEWLSLLTAENEELAKVAAGGLGYGHTPAPALRPNLVDAADAQSVTQDSQHVVDDVISEEDVQHLAVIGADWNAEQHLSFWQVITASVFEDSSPHSDVEDEHAITQGDRQGDRFPLPSLSSLAHMRPTRDMPLLEPIASVMRRLQPLLGSSQRDEVDISKLVDQVSRGDALGEVAISRSASRT